jgi:hypothetical protein
MCFSAEADLIAGVVVGAIGVDAVRHVRRRAEWPLAVIPLLLGGHQLVEVLVWWGLRGRLGEAVWRPALWVYLAIAFGMLPVLVPVAVGALEPEMNRRRVGLFAVVGGVVSVMLMYALLRGPVTASIRGHHIDYRVDLWHGGLIVTLYVLATCGSLLASKHSHVRWFGGANVIATCLLAWLDQRGFISLWCAWAAVTSVAVAVHLRYARQPPPRELAEAVAET